VNPLHFLKVSAQLLLFLPGYLRDIIRSNFRVAHDVITLRHRMQPILIWVPVERRLHDWQILVVANLITMTPGTFCLEYDPSRQSLLIHLMYKDEEAQVREEVTRIASLVGGVS